MKNKITKKTIQEIRWGLLEKNPLKVVSLKIVSAKESRIIDAYRLVNKDQDIDFLDDFQEENNVFNVLENNKELLIWQ